ncbi:MAG: hypothetical protein ACJAQ4_000978 [Cryomorphaceae bacterium]|jgi:hypothetical protein
MRFLKWFAIVVLVLMGLGIIGFQILKHNTKKQSPETTMNYEEGGMNIEVVYSRPFKKDREIFGGLVPYGEVWRTGANEATTFKTETDLIIAGKSLPKGEYTLWTIPNASNWEVIFNNGDYGWGVNLKSVASRDPEFDVLNITVPVQRNFKVLEQFTIEIERTPPALLFSWDFTRVDVPLSIGE